MHDISIECVSHKKGKSQSKEFMDEAYFLPKVSLCAKRRLSLPKKYDYLD